MRFILYVTLHPDEWKSFVFLPRRRVVESTWA
jgi:hypothetical protein